MTFSMRWRTRDAVSVFVDQIGVRIERTWSTPTCATGIAPIFGLA